MDAFVELDELNRRTIKCAPYPARWKSFCQVYKLVWTTIRFSRENRSRVPDRPGIYCFFVGNNAKALPRVGYPLYVGVAGIRGTGAARRTLRQRFADYLTEKDDPRGRLQIRRFLNVFDGELAFLCAPGSISAKGLLEMEKQLNDALMPAYSVKDFSARIGAQRRAWQA